MFHFGCFALFAGKVMQEKKFVKPRCTDSSDTRIGHREFDAELVLGDFVMQTLLQEEWYYNSANQEHREERVKNSIYDDIPITLIDLYYYPATTEVAQPKPSPPLPQYRSHFVGHSLPK